jgi:hypothetical protein
MTNYFGVIGNRDHIKIQGDRRPFWEFLDRQPDGWLSSLAYLPLRDFEMPSGPKIADCGAWSYKDQDVPKLGKNLVTPDWVLGEYQKYFGEGDLVVAPDHMLIPGTDLDYRRQFNINSAKTFLPIAIAAGFRPMATVHGMDLDERLINIGRLYEIGYRHFSLGGMAARASQKRLLIESITALKDKIRGLLPDAYIHVLGLSSPDYWAAFNHLGIDSCDGSSHFKQAFTGGAFFTVENGRLVKHLAGRIDRETGELIKPADVPECLCMACSRLRGEGVDTRYYGSNESNMGRAAHNLNMLMQAQSVANANGASSPFIPRVGTVQDVPRIALVSCAGQKKAEPSPAFDLYQSAWFRKCDQYVVSQKYDSKFVISAKHGLVSDGEIVEPYEQTLNDMPIAARKIWAESVFSQVLAQFPDGAEIDIYAGNRYRDHLVSMLINAGYRVTVPLEGLGIGQQLAWFDSKNSTQLRLW